ncbi:hypothetical protein ACFQX7_39150 [Luedemannella flava]
MEIRIADSQQDVSAVLLYASIAAALVDAALAPGATNVPVTLDTDELRLEIWRAARYGTETILRSPVSGLRVGFWQLFDELIATLAPYFAATADAEAIFGLISAMRVLPMVRYDGGWRVMADISATLQVNLLSTVENGHHTDVTPDRREFLQWKTKTFAGLAPIGPY